MNSKVGGCDLLLLEWQVVFQQVFVASRQRFNAEIRDAVREMVTRVPGLATLELGVQM